MNNEQFGVVAAANVTAKLVVRGVMVVVGFVDVAVVVVAVEAMLVGLWMW